MIESTRITVARVLELGVRISWREATAIVHEAVAGTGGTNGAGPARVSAESCLLTRGGDVMLEGTAAQARREVVVRLLDDLLASCSDPGRFAGAVANGTALEMIEELSQHTSPKRRRVEVASVALRGLAAAADAARARADAEEHDQLADLDDFIAAPTPATSPTARRRPWPMVQDQTGRRGDSAFGTAEVGRPGFDHEDLVVAGGGGRERPTRKHAVAALAIATSPAQGSRPAVTLRPVSFSIDPPRIAPQVDDVRTAKDVRGRDPSRFDWVKRASPAALVCLILGVAAAAILGLQFPVIQRSAVAPPEPGVEPSEPAVEPPDPAIEQSEPAIGPPRTEGPVGPEDQTPVAGQEPNPLPELADPPSVPRAPRGLPTIEGRTAPFAAQDSFVRPIVRPAGGPETPVDNTTTIAAPPSRSSPTAAAAIPPPAPAASAPPPAVAPSPIVASPTGTAFSPVETPGSASTNVPANDVARPASRELETRAIENVLGRYRSAFNTLDASAASAVWPTVNEKTLAKAFERLESHDVSFENCQIDIYSVRAEAACSGNARYVPKVGSQTPKDEARRWTFTLRKADGEWLIDRVDAR